jgi:hypothetical protein
MARFTTRTKTKNAFIHLSPLEKLKISFNAAKTEQEKFILCVQYASLIENYPPYLCSSNDAALLKKGIIDLIKWYLDKSKISPNTKDSAGNTALSYAVFCPEVVDLLLERGANPNLKNDGEKGDAPLHKIAENLVGIDTKALLKSASLLVAADADRYLQNNATKTPYNLIPNLSDVFEDNNLHSEYRQKFIQATDPAFASKFKASFVSTSELLSFHNEEPPFPLFAEDLQMTTRSQEVEEKTPKNTSPDLDPIDLLPILDRNANDSYCELDVDELVEGLQTMTRPEIEPYCPPIEENEPPLVHNNQSYIDRDIDAIKDLPLHTTINSDSIQTVSNTESFGALHSQSYSNVFSVDSSQTSREEKPKQEDNAKSFSPTNS